MYGSTSTTTHVKFLGIEDFWGNCYYWVDGICSSSYNILTYYKNMTGTDSGANYQFSCASGVTSDIKGYVSNVVGTNHGGFVPKAISGSSSTYYTDYAILNSSYCAHFGDYWGSGSYAGAFQLYVNSSPSYYTQYISARLLYKHLAQ